MSAEFVELWTSLLILRFALAVPSHVSSALREHSGTRLAQVFLCRSSDIRSNRARIGMRIQLVVRGRLDSIIALLRQSDMVV